MKKLLTILLLLSLLCAPSFADRRIVEYMVVQEGNNSDLIGQVNKMILNGWEPFGDVCICSELARSRFQAMVKYEEAAE